MIECNKPVRRKVNCQSNWIRSGKLVIAIYPNGEIGFRELRARGEYRLSYAEAFRHAVEVTTWKKAQRVRALRREGLTLKEARRAAKKEFGL